MHLLNRGDPFPRLTMNVPDAFAGDFATRLAHVTTYPMPAAVPAACP
jgi:hypothetical protein